MPQTNSPLIGGQEAAELLGIDRSTLSRWVSAGKIAPAQRLNGRTGAFLFERSAVDAFNAYRKTA